MKLYCPICFEKLGIKEVLEIAGYPTKKPLYCKECNKAFTYNQAIKPTYD